MPPIGIIFVAYLTCFCAGYALRGYISYRRRERYLTNRPRYMPRPATETMAEILVLKSAEFIYCAKSRGDVDLVGREANALPARLFVARPADSGSSR